MKKTLLLLFLLYGQLFALERVSTLKLYHHLFSNMSKKSIVSVYIEDKEYREVFSTSSQIQLVDNLMNADFIFITSQKLLEEVAKDKINKKAIILATKYQYLEKSENIIGAFYWRKGRPQYLFIEKRLKAHNITLPRDYQKFIVDEL